MVFNIIKDKLANFFTSFYNTNNISSLAQFIVNFIGLYCQPVAGIVWNSKVSGDSAGLSGFFGLTVCPLRGSPALLAKGIASFRSFKVSDPVVDIV